MSSARSSSIETRQRILEAARDLFAKHGVDGASVRDIAAAAGVTHPLVHRYFGTKSQMVSEILRREMQTLGSLAAVTPRGSTSTESLEAIRATLLYVIKESRTTVLLLLRAEMDGLKPEGVLEEVPSPLTILMEWVKKHAAAEDLRRFEMMSVAAGAAIFGYIAAAPWLLHEVGLQDEDEEIIREQFVDALVRFVALTVGIQPLGAPEGAS